MSSTHLVVWIFSRMAQQLNCLWLCYSVKNTIETCGNGSIKKEATEISMSFQKKNDFEFQRALVFDLGIFIGLR